MVYRVKVVVVGDSYAYFFTNFTIAQERSRFSSPDKAVNDKGRELVKRVFEIEGVTEIEISRHQLSVQISPAAFWSEIEPLVYEALKEVFGIDQLEIIEREVYAGIVYR